MEISNFSLRDNYDFFATTGEDPSSGTAWRQSYAVSITNLGERTYAYALEFGISDVRPGWEQPRPGAIRIRVNSPGYEPTSSSAGFGASGALVPGRDPHLFEPDFGAIPVPPGQTAHVHVYPEHERIRPRDERVEGSWPPNLEFHGFARIRLPPLIRSLEYLVPTAQSEVPVPVLMAAEHLTWHKVTPGWTEVYSHSRSALPLATGQARIFLEPEPGGFVVITPRDLDEITEEGVEWFRRISGRRIAEAFLSGISGVDLEPEALARVNETLKAGGARLRLVREDGGRKAGDPSPP